MMNQYLDLLAHFGIGGAHPGGMALTHSIFAKEKIKPQDHVLDIGCGTGKTASFLAKNFNCTVSAIDLHPTMIEKAKKRFTTEGLTIKAILGDVQNMEFADHSFNYVLSESVISFTDISKTLSEIARVLKENGCLLMIEMTAEQDLSDDVKEKVVEIYGIDEVLTEKEWISRLQQVGFADIEKIPTSGLLIPSEIADMDLSDHISMALHDVWEAHNQFIEQNGHLINYRVFKCYLR